MKFPIYLQNSFFLNILRSSTSQPHERLNAGNAAITIPFIGEISVNMTGPKNIMNTTTIMTTSVIFSFMVLGGVKNIFWISISNRSASFFNVLFSFHRYRFFYDHARAGRLFHVLHYLIDKEHFKGGC